MSPMVNQLSALFLAALAAPSFASPMPQTSNPVPAVRQSQCVSEGVSNPVLLYPVLTLVPGNNSYRVILH